MVCINHTLQPRSAGKLYREAGKDEPQPDKVRVDKPRLRHDSGERPPAMSESDPSDDAPRRPFLAPLHLVRESNARARARAREIRAWAMEAIQAAREARQMAQECRAVRRAVLTPAARGSAHARRDTLPGRGNGSR